MYQIFSHISRMTSGTLPHPGTEGVKTTQLSDNSAQAEMAVHMLNRVEDNVKFSGV